MTEPIVPKRQILDVVYVTVEGECKGCGENLAVWCTSYVHKTSKIEDWKRPPLRGDGMSVLQKKDDEAVLVMFREVDGRVGTILWPVAAFLTKDELHAEIQGRIEAILAGALPRFGQLVPFNPSTE